MLHRYTRPTDKQLPFTLLFCLIYTYVQFTLGSSKTLADYKNKLFDKLKQLNDEIKMCLKYGVNSYLLYSTDVRYVCLITPTLRKSEIFEF